MLFFSPFSAFVVGIRPEAVFYHPSTGVETHRVRRLAAEFGQHLGEYTYTDPLTNTVERGAEIKGNYFDTDAAAETLRWTPEEKESVEQRLIWLCTERPGLIRHVEFVAPVVLPPWPTYDGLTSEQAVQYAQDLGLAAEALLYEKENAKRPVVVEALEAVLAENPAEGPPRNVVAPEREEYIPARGGESRVVVV